MRHRMEGWLVRNELKKWGRKRLQTIFWHLSERTWQGFGPRIKFGASRIWDRNSIHSTATFGRQCFIPSEYNIYIFKIFFTYDHDHYYYYYHLHPLPINFLKMHVKFWLHFITFIKLQCLADAYCNSRALSLTPEKNTPQKTRRDTENYITTKLAQVVSTLRFPVRISAEILSWFSWFTSVPSCKFQDSILHYFTMAFVHTRYNSLLFTIIKPFDAIQCAVLAASLSKLQRCNN
jgi:hypothetical protein